MSGGDREEGIGGPRMVGEGIGGGIDDSGMKGGWTTSVAIAGDCELEPEDPISWILCPSTKGFGSTFVDSVDR